MNAQRCYSAYHHRINCETSQGITEKNRQRSSVSKCSSNTQEQTSSNGAAKCDELNMSRLQASRDIAVLLSSLNITEDFGGFVDLRASTSLTTSKYIVVSLPHNSGIPRLCSPRPHHTHGCLATRTHRQCDSRGSSPWRSRAIGCGCRRNEVRREYARECLDTFLTARRRTQYTRRRNAHRV